MYSLPVAAVCDDFPLRALWVSPEITLEHVLEQSLDQTQKGTAIVLINRDETLTGIIEPKDILTWGQMHLGLLSMPSKLTERKLWRLARAQKASDLVLYIYELMSYIVRHSKGKIHA